MTLLWPWMLLTLLLVPLFAVGYLRLLRKRQQAAVDLGPLGVMRDPSGRNPSRQRHIPAGLLLLGLTCTLFGLARPTNIYRRLTSTSHKAAWLA